MDTGKLVMFGALGVGAYYLYQKYAAAAVSAGPAVALLAAPAAPAAASQMDSWYSQLKSAATSDPANFTGSGDALLSSADHWNYFLKSITGYDAPLDTLFGAVDLTTQIRATPAVTAAAFWSQVAPGLKSAKGLAGLGMYGGLGRICYGMEWN